MKITLRQLEVFICVAKNKNVSLCAEKLLLTQSAVSMSLAELEHILGGELFDRPGKRLVLNDRGRALLPRAVEICDRADEIENLLQIRTVSQRLESQSKANEQIKLSGSLKIAASTTIGNYLIPAVMGSFVAEHPDVHLSLDVKNSSEVLQSVLQFDADAGFVEGLVHESDLDISIWLTDYLVVIASPRHPLAQKRIITAKHLENSYWIMRERGSGTREILEQALQGNVNKIKFLLELGNSEAVKSSVESSPAISCLSRLTVANDLARGRFIELKTPFLKLQRNFYIVLHRKKYHTTLLDSFLDFAGDFSAQE